MAGTLGNFADILIRRGLVGPDQLREAETLADAKGIPVPEALIQSGYVASNDVMRAVAEEHSLEFVDLTEVRIPLSAVELVPESVARENVVMPMAEDEGALKVIISNPLDLETIDKLRFILNRKIEIALAPRENITEAINHYYGQQEGESADTMLQEFTDTAIDFTDTMEQDTMTMAGDESIDETSAPVVRLVQMMISEAVQLRASDIHIEPFEDRVRIRYRIDGRLIERDSPPRRMLGAILSRLKILGGIDISERRRCQDGRIKADVGTKTIDLRVSVIPTNHGQSIVMRILDKDSIKVGIRQLGLSDNNFVKFNNLLRRPNGIILVTGPTGSGKTTTLYAALNELNRPDTKIITAEDPVEYYLPGINQTQVRHSIGLDFAKIIKAMLRQAPNIILVGEMRDTETASMGIQASLTGHLVFSTLHTNDAPGAITRLIDMGVPSYLVSSTIIGVLAQRLVRVICEKCKAPTKPSKEILESAGITPEMAEQATFMKGRGCGNCQRSGYRGRMGIFELMPMNSKLRELAFQGAATQEIRKGAVATGMDTLFDDGLKKAMMGKTTLEEVFRVAKVVEK
ncbi:type II/IV secretion system protein [Bremerella cremea]|uniref:Type II/IV secretion system protein n=1 Tax=Bremerella cremea TaxID=1031537 RepID=A0A368KVV2_9BACT|nr:GspE/PulE family protein [Bremerella cremea]RCS54548.1 type II/IV secretion system protein [Bremerella cremea]